MRYIKTPLITDTAQLRSLQCGQWIQLAWCDRPSRFSRMDERGNVTAFHFPGAARRFASYHTLSKAAEGFAAFNRHARRMASGAPLTAQAANG